MHGYWFERQPEVTTGRIARWALVQAGAALGAWLTWSVVGGDAGVVISLVLVAVSVGAAFRASLLLVAQQARRQADLDAT